MFSVLPPPPRYPNQAAYNAAVAAGQAAPMIETNNVLATPSGPEYQLLVAEGTYVLRDDLQLATPPPHPSEPVVVNPNPLATTPQPASAGTKLSLISLSSRALGPPLYKTATNISGLQTSIQEQPNEGGSSTDITESSDTGPEPSQNGSSKPPASFRSAPAFGEGNAMLAAAPMKDSSKRRKPKNNIAKSNSSFISRVIVNENLAKKLSDRPTDGLFVFANINRAYQWLDLSSATKQEHLTKILFTKGHCLCHDINNITKGPGHIDLIMGFSTGEIIWYEPMSQKYTRLNKNGAINATPVAEIRWIPGSENLFLAAHMDGSLVVYDKEKEDSPFIAEDNGCTNGYTNGNTNGTGLPGINMQLHKSLHSKNQKTNPVAFWKLSNQRINAFAFSPDNRHLAVVSEDGSLRIIDYLSEKLLHIFPSYYAGLSCVCWSPDGKYILTGGQDDLVTIWSFADAAIVARCAGHQSWLTAVAFDPWRCDDKNYRFGSVGEDCRLLLWDFSVGMLHRPKALSVRQRGSISSRFPNALHKMESQTTGRPRADSGLSDDEEDGNGAVKHDVASRSHVPELPPVASKRISEEPLCWLDFTEESIITSCKKGHIRTWDRPQEHPNASQVALGGNS